MENPNNYRYGSITRELPFLLPLEFLVGIMSVLITVTSSLVIKHIHEKTKKSRADLMFIVLSISDIGVAVISMPALGILGPLWENLLDSFYNSSPLPFALTVICYDFPYTFSYLVTPIIALDRFFIITQQKKYENFITMKRLICIVILVLIIAFANCIVTYYVIPVNFGNVTAIMRKSYLIVNVVSMVVILTAYLYILYFVHRQSLAMKTCKYSNTKSNKKLTLKILYIFICQIFCILPYLLMHMIDEFGGYVPVLLVAPWLSLLRNSQCFCDGLILLHNEKQKKKKMSAATSHSPLPMESICSQGFRNN